MNLGTILPLCLVQILKLGNVKLQSNLDQLRLYLTILFTKIYYNYLCITLVFRGLYYLSRFFCTYLNRFYELWCSWAGIKRPMCILRPSIHAPPLYIYYTLFELRTATRDEGYGDNRHSGQTAVSAAQSQLVRRTQTYQAKSFAYVTLPTLWSLPV